MLGHAARVADSMNNAWKPCAAWMYDVPSPARRNGVHVEFIHTLIAITFLSVMALISQIIMRPRNRE